MLQLLIEDPETTEADFIGKISILSVKALVDDEPKKIGKLIIRDNDGNIIGSFPARLVNMKHEIKSVEWFEENRPEHYELVKIIEKCDKDAIISTGVKVGKLEMMLIQARRSFSNPLFSMHIFISNFNRKDCREQQDQLEEYGVKTFYAKDLSKVKLYVENIPHDKKIIFHVDESDYGTGEKQKLISTFRYIRELKAIRKSILFRFYSATNEEAIYSPFREQCEIFILPDPSSYFGADDYLDASLVKEAEPLWDMTKKCFSQQGEECFKWWDDSNKDCKKGSLLNKPYAVLRVSQGTSKKQPNALTFRKLMHDLSFKKALQSRGIEAKFINGDNGFFWGDVDKSPWGTGQSWTDLDRSRRWLFVVNQTCVRSTKIGFHPLIAFWHDFRNKSTTYGTCHQAMLRVVYYPYSESGYWNNSNVNIKVYGCVETFRLAARIISIEDYVRSSGRQISQRVKKGKRDKVKYRITYQKTPPSDSVISKVSAVGKSKDGTNNSLAKAILKQIPRAAGSRVYYIDGPNKDYQEDWNDLIREKPYIRGLYAIFHESSRDSQAPQTQKSVYNNFGEERVKVLIDAIPLNDNLAVGEKTQNLVAAK